jgi:hypothetical protein
MLNRMLLMLVLVSAVGIVLPSKAGAASRDIVGRVTDYNGTSLSVRDREVLTVTLDSRTTYTKLITQKPWQEDTRLSARALSVGRFVAVHVRTDDPTVAEWVQIATDRRTVALAAAPSSALSAATPSPLAAPTSNSGDLLTSKQVTELIATANTAADHVKLQAHFLALAAKRDADANAHAAEAQAYRKNPSFMESKNPVGPGTATHCDRFAELDREAAKEARDLASSHGYMAAAK